MHPNNNQPTRVLLVDDDSALLRSLERVFLERGLEVESASCAAVADAFLNRFDFDVVVCDHNMPGKTGLEFLADLKEKKPDLITLMLSGQISGVSVAEDWAKEIGVHAVFPKPFDSNAIVDEINLAMEVKAFERLQQLEADEEAEPSISEPS